MDASTERKSLSMTGVRRFGKRIYNGLSRGNGFPFEEMLMLHRLRAVGLLAG